VTTPALLAPSPELTHLAQIIQLAVAPVFLLAGIGAFLNVCAGRLARIVDRARALEPRILASRGSEHDRLVGEVRLLDRRIRVVNAAIFTTVLAALIISAVVVLLFVAFLTGYKIGTAVALLFIAAMIFTGLSFAIFLYETRLGTRSVRVRSHILDHEADPSEE
jgi:MFS family permease